MKLGPVMQDTPVIFDRIITNIGEGFDEYSSHFVCRTNGTYVFMTHILGQNNKDVYAWIMMNNKHKVPLHGDSRAGYGTGSQSIILHLKYDDHVWIQLSKDSGLLNDYSTFSGYLLFEDWYIEPGVGGISPASEGAGDPLGYRGWEGSSRAP